MHPEWQATDMEPAVWFKRSVNIVIFFVLHYVIFLECNVLVHHPIERTLYTCLFGEPDGKSQWNFT